MKRSIFYSAFSFALIAFSVLAPSTSRAGFIEIGASGSYRHSNFDVNAYDESRTVTGSVAYYFSDASALELSYTDGQNKRAISEDVTNGHVTWVYYNTAGLDFVYTFGAKDSVLRPYVKGGANYIISKRIIDQFRLPDGSFFGANTIEDSPGLVPSAGFGFRFGLTESLALKVGVDGWSSRVMSQSPVTIDWYGKAGVSWFF
jgi:outer membrane protein W